MELWIRSQNRERLTTVCDLRIVYLGEEKLWAIDCCDYVGFYQTKERALEVLYEIQEAQLGNFHYRCPSKVKVSSKEDTIVYEMPKE